MHYLLGNKGAHTTNGNIFECEQCGQQYDAETEFQEHDCKPLASYLEYQYATMEEWDQTYETDNTCEYCEQSFTSLGRLRQHRCLFCKTCKRVLSSAQRLDMHRCRKHSKDDDVGLACDKCKQTFTSLGRLKQHTCLYCDTCSRAFQSKRGLSKHRCIPEPDQDVYTCIQCEQTFTSHARLQQHRSANHQGQENIDSIQCALCNQRYKVGTHHKCLYCNKCQKLFADTNELDDHTCSIANLIKVEPTMAMITNTPTNQSELHLYRVLEKANLLTYYDSFIQQGGDDVQQLCEASEEEFLEIMALVGMSSKPLHVRRLQKALQDWVTNPEKFNAPLTSPPQNLAIPFSLGLQATQPNKASLQNKFTASAGSIQDQALLMSMTASGSMPQIASPLSTSSSRIGAGDFGLINHEENPILMRETVESLKEAAEIVMSNEQPSLSPPPILNRKLVKDLQHIFDMSLEHPDRLAEIRKWSAIYGRFDSKRKSDKPLTLHEVTVNEAAAQLCDLDPYLLAQREKLFPLARQVVRESGYRYKHGHSRHNTEREERPESAKKPKLDNSYRDPDSHPNPRTVQAELMKLRREERMNEITSLLTTIKQKQSDTKASIVAAKSEDNLQKVYDLQIELEKLTTQQLLLMTEQTDLIKKQRRSDRYYVAKAREKAENENGEGSEADNNSEIPDDSVGDENSSHVGPPSESSQTEETETPVPVSIATTPTKQSKKKSANPTRLLVQHTLMDEGLRLAQHASQAYGLLDDTSQDVNTAADESSIPTADMDTKPVIIKEEVTNDDAETTVEQTTDGIGHATLEQAMEGIGQPMLEQATEGITQDLLRVINGGEQNGHDQ
ncbi:uncharacterized protein [Amphiura filiformis]|uniref:uncharacterized protein isoform X2 n=1 Tax=Amphiura filiformis TaxID=82378 RepID=UPI003B219842